MSSGPLSRVQLMELDSELTALQFNGTFLDPYANSSTSKRWSVGQFAAYFAWWSFRPSHCAQCGAVDAWMASPDHEYKCLRCGSGAGTTATNDIVEDMPGGEEDDDDGGGNHIDPAGIHTGAAAAAAAATGTTSGGGEAVQSTLLTIQQLLGLLRALPTEVALSVQDYPSILRVAVNIIHLFLLPEMNEESTLIVKCSALYVSCTVVTKGLVPFPLFQVTCGVELQWLDIDNMYRHLGIDSFGNKQHDFFASPTAAIQFQVNLMTFCQDYRPPSISWHLERASGRTEYALSLAKKRRRRFSPEQTAAVIILDCIRLYQKEHGTDEAMVQWFEKASIARFRRYKLLESTWASTMLCIFAHAFKTSSLEVLEMVHASGLYQGEMFFHSSLAESICMNRKYVMPLQRRLSPVRSPWQVIYEALHSDDRHVLLSLLHRISTSAAGQLEDQEAQKAVINILRRHGSCYAYQFTYSIRCTDDQFGGKFQGVYFCTHVSHNGAIYTCLKTARKTITYCDGEGGGNNNGTIFLNAAGSRERKTSNLAVQFMGPMVTHLESNCAKLLIDCAVSGTNVEQWNEAQIRLHALQLVRRRLRSSRSPLQTLSNIKDFFVSSSSIMDRSGTTNITADSLTPVTETSCLKEVQRLIVLPHAAVLSGLSDDAIVASYSALRALVEKKKDKLLVRLRDDDDEGEDGDDADDQQNGGDPSTPHGRGTSAVPKSPLGAGAGMAPQRNNSGVNQEGLIAILPKKVFKLDDAPELRAQLGKAIKTLQQQRHQALTVAREAAAAAAAQRLSEAGPTTPNGQLGCGGGMSYGGMQSVDL